MRVLRKIALGLLLSAATAVLAMAAWELWSYRRAVDSPVDEPGFSTGERSRNLQSRMDLLAKRVSDMEVLVLILLGTSGLYAIVFVASSYFSATGFARQADQTIQNIQDQIGLAMGDLRALQENNEELLRELTAAASLPQPPAPAPSPAGLETEISEITARLTLQNRARRDRPFSEQARLELIQDEHQAAYLEAMAGAGASPAVCTALAALYLAFGCIYSSRQVASSNGTSGNGASTHGASSDSASSDSARSRFYLEHALGLAPPASALASEIHYQLACRFAASHDFPRAARELEAAFEHRFKTLDEKLAGDIDEGGQLYELASTAPFDKAVNDLLLNMSVGIG